MTIGMYVLRDREPIPCDDRLAWGRFMESSERIVRQDSIGPLWVSTVFLGINHGRLGRSDRPVLFETMILGDDIESYQTRCCTWAEAERMHAVALPVAERMYQAAKVVVDAALKTET